MVVVFFVSWLLFGFLNGFMVYVTPDHTKGHVIAAVVLSWMFAMIVACLVYVKRNPSVFKKEEPEDNNVELSDPEGSENAGDTQNENPEGEETEEEPES